MLVARGSRGDISGTYVRDGVAVDPRLGCTAAVGLLAQLPGVGIGLARLIGVRLVSTGAVAVGNLRVEGSQNGDADADHGDADFDGGPDDETDGALWTGLVGRWARCRSPWLCVTDRCSL